MNDRFKLRVWDVQNQKYLYFDLLDSDSLNDFAFFASEIAPDYNEQIKSPDTNCWALKAEQCTGLKDINGKLIYEGDIVMAMKDDTLCFPTKFDQFPVVWTNLRFDLRTKINDKGDSWSGVLNCECEIIGNIHQNPELLK